MQLETKIEWTHKYAARLWVRDCRDAVGDTNWLSTETNLEAMIERVGICTRRPRSSELRHGLEGWDLDSLEMQSVTKIEQTQRYTGRLWLSEFEYALGGWNCVNGSLHSKTVIEQIVEIHLQDMIEWNWRSTWRRYIWRWSRQQLRLYSLVYS
jgi:hypothetical protein